MSQAFKLSHRADVRELPVFSGTLELRDLLQGESQYATWRLVEVFSDKGLPFELELRWSGGAGSGAWSKLTVASATRICLFARSITLRAANLSSDVNRVGVTIADGFAPTTNTYEQRDTCDAVTPVRFSIPPFAQTFSLQLADRGKLPGAVISFFDGTGAVRGQVSGATQPGEGILVGGTGRIEVLTSSPTDLKGIFTLAL